MEGKNNKKNINIKKRKRISQLTLFLIVFILPFVINIYLNSSLNYSGMNLKDIENINIDKEELKNSLISGRIHISDNWSDAVLAGICSGSGNYTDPYIIEDLVIDGGNSSSCILIENSNDYFKIINCSVFNSGEGEYNAGIKLYYANNGTLINNTCINNNGNGIYLDYSKNNTISYNNASFNNEVGIEIFGYGNNIITKNTATNNTLGIKISSTNNLILENILTHNVWSGINLVWAPYNNISYNDISFNGNGISLESSIKNNISGNYISFNDFTGIELVQSDYNFFSRNTIINNMYYGIEIWIGSENNTIAKNKINNNIGGINVYSAASIKISVNSLYDNHIHIYSSNYTEILDNNITAYSYGIFISGNSYSSDISGNKLFGCGFSIDGPLEALVSNNIDYTNLVNDHPLYYYSNKKELMQSHFINAGQVILINCSKSLLAYVDISYATTGIILFYSSNNIITLVECSDNVNYGISLNYCEDIIISESTFIDNGLSGIYLQDSINVEIQENKITKSYDGLSLYRSNNNSISNNTIKENGNGMYLMRSHYNTIINNTITNNDYYGIYLYESNFNLIKGNDLRHNINPWMEENCVGNIFEENLTEDITGGESDDGKRKQAIPIEIGIIIIFSIISIIVIVSKINLKKRVVVL